MSVETRSIDRDSLFITAELVFDGDTTPRRVKVRNLSAGGMMVEHEMPVKRGQKVAIELRNIPPFLGEVMWVRGPRFGVAFEHEIDPKLPRTQVYGGHKEAPVYARAPVAPPRTESWSGRMRRI